MIPNGSWFSGRRRRLLGLLGAAAGGVVPSLGGVRGETADSYVVQQGERCLPLVALSGDVPVEEFYGYQLPDGLWEGENGSRDDGGPYYSSLGTRDLQRGDTSLLFLYDGPDGLSLVIVHDATDWSDHGGGSATFTFDGLPAGGEWVVRDDYYLDPETGEIADTNYDRWRIDGSTHVVSWTWGTDATDGGAFRGLDGDFAVEIDPAFDEDAERLEHNYEGQVVEWQALSGDLADPDRYSLDVEQPVTIRPGSCDEEGDDGQGDEEDDGGQDDDGQDDGTEDGTDDESQTDDGGSEGEEKRRTKHEKKRRKHEKKHEKKRRKHEKKHEKKRRKHEKKHERKQKKHERKKKKHEKD